jgi:hypothetical protein
LRRTSNNKGKLPGDKEEPPLLTGVFGKWYNWHQRVDDGGSIPKLQLRGVRLVDPRVTNKKYTETDFRNPAGAHVEIVTKVEIKNAIQDGITDLPK